MWQVFYGPDLIYDPRDPDLALVGMAGKNTLNQTGSFEFSMPPSHPFAGTLNLLQKDVEIIVKQDGKTRFIGRLMPAEQEFFGMTKYFAEGERGYLNDVVLPVYTTGMNGVPSTVDGLFNWYISEYNARVAPKHRFIVGKNEGYLLDANNYVLRESSQRPTVWSEIKEKLLEKLGGFIRVRHEGDIRYIDYLADGGLASAQRIEFGRNLTDYMRRVDPTNFCTVVIPLGKEVEDEEGNAGDKLDISALPDGNLQEGFIKRGDRIISVEGVEKYGEIEQTVHFDDVTTPEYLLQAGLRNLINRRFGDTLEIKAVDLHALDPSIEPFEYGDYIRVTSKPHGIDEYFMCVETPFSPGDPAAESLVLGNTYDTLTGKQSSCIAALNASINKTYEAIAPIDAAAKAAAKDAEAAQQTAEAAQEQAESKSKNWTAQPVPPYGKDDTWAQGADGDILICGTAKLEGEAFSATDWVPASKYTDDEAASDAKLSADNANETADQAIDAAFDAQDTAQEADAKATAAKETAEATASHFWHDLEGAHIASAKGNATTGNNVLITAAAIILRKGTDALLSIKQSVIEFLGKQGYIGLSDTSPLGENRKGFELFSAIGRSLNLYSEGTDGVRIIANSKSLKDSAAIYLGEKLLRLGVGNGLSDEFGSGSYFELRPEGVYIGGYKQVMDKGIIHGNYFEGTAVWYEVRAGLVVITMKLYDGVAGGWISLGTMPAGLRPKSNTTAGLTRRYYNDVGVFEAKADGTVQYQLVVAGDYVGQVMYALT